MMNSSGGEQCSRRQQLIDDAQRMLSLLADLAHAEGDAVRSQNGELMMEIDAQIEHALGEKERILGALAEHKKEHGC